MCAPIPKERLRSARQLLLAGLIGGQAQGVVQDNRRLDATGRRSRKRLVLLNDGLDLSLVARHAGAGGKLQRLEVRLARFRLASLERGERRRGEVDQPQGGFVTDHRCQRPPRALGIMNPERRFVCDRVVATVVRVRVEVVLADARLPTRHRQQSGCGSTRIAHDLAVDLPVVIMRRPWSYIGPRIIDV